MKLCTFTDVHGDLNAVERVKETASNVDVLVGSGDFSVFENNLHRVMDEVGSIEKPTITIHGNHESHDSLRDACEEHAHVRVLHREHDCLDDVLFMGYGGGGFSLEYEDFESIRPAFEEAMKEYTSVLVVHGPPYRTELDHIRGEHVGNKTIRSFIDDAEPDLVVCGHLHENFGKHDVIGDTYIINPGPHGRVVQLERQDL